MTSNNWGDLVPTGPIVLRTQAEVLRLKQQVNLLQKKIESTVQMAIANQQRLAIAESTMTTTTSKTSAADEMMFMNRGVKRKRWAYMENPEHRFNGGQRWQWCIQQQRKSGVPYPKNMHILMMHMIRRGLSLQRDMVDYVEYELPILYETYFKNNHVGIVRWLKKSERRSRRNIKKYTGIRGWFSSRLLRDKCNRPSRIWTINTALPPEQLNQIMEVYNTMRVPYAHAYNMPSDSDPYTVTKHRHHMEEYELCDLDNGEMAHPHHDHDEIKKEWIDDAIMPRTYGGLPVVVNDDSPPPEERVPSPSCMMKEENVKDQEPCIHGNGPVTKSEPAHLLFEELPPVSNEEEVRMSRPPNNVHEEYPLHVAIKEEPWDSLDNNDIVMGKGRRHLILHDDEPLQERDKGKLYGLLL